MKNLKIAVNVISWSIIFLLGVMMILKWNEIGQQVKMHSDLAGGFSMGDKSILLAIYIMEIIVNIVFTKGYDIPMTKELRRKNSTSFLPDIINVFLQMTACLVLSAFVLSAI